MMVVGRPTRRLETAPAAMANVVDTLLPADTTRDGPRSGSPLALGAGLARRPVRIRRARVIPINETLIRLLRLPLAQLGYRLVSV
jgi:hypothetical protein